MADNAIYRYPSTFGYGSYNRYVNVPQVDVLEVPTLFRTVRDKMVGSGTRLKAEAEGDVDVISLSVDFSKILRVRHWSRYLGTSGKFISRGNDTRFTEGVHIVSSAMYYMFLRKSEVPVIRALDGALAFLFFDAEAPPESSDWQRKRYCHAHSISPYSMRMLEVFFEEWVEQKASLDALSDDFIERVIDAMFYISSGFVYQGVRPLPPTTIVDVEGLSFSEKEWDENWYMTKDGTLFKYVRDWVNALRKHVEYQPVTHVRGSSLDEDIDERWFSRAEHNHASFVANDTLFSFSDVRTGFSEKRDFLYNHVIKDACGLSVSKQGVICLRNVTVLYSPRFEERLRYADFQTTLYRIYMAYHEAWSSHIFGSGDVSPVELMSGGFSNIEEARCLLSTVHRVTAPGTTEPGWRVFRMVGSLKKRSRERVERLEFYGRRALEFDPLIDVSTMLVLGTLLYAWRISERKLVYHHDKGFLFAPFTGTLYLVTSPLSAYGSARNDVYEVPSTIDDVPVRVVATGAFWDMDVRHVVFESNDHDVTLVDGAFDFAWSVQAVTFAKNMRVGSSLFGAGNTERKRHVSFTIPYGISYLANDFAAGVSPSVRISASGEKDVKRALESLRMLSYTRSFGFVSFDEWCERIDFTPPPPVEKEAFSRYADGSDDGILRVFEPRR